MKNMVASSIVLHGLELNISLGWPDLEQSLPQMISIDVHILFQAPPLACVTDNLNDTFCYDYLTKVIKHFIASRPFRLIEHVGYALYQEIKTTLGEGHAIYVRVNKKPPIEHLTNGVSFCYGDKDATWSF